MKSFLALLTTTSTIQSLLLLCLQGKTVSAFVKPHHHGPFVRQQASDRSIANVVVISNPLLQTIPNPPTSCSGSRSRTRSSPTSLKALPAAVTTLIRGGGGGSASASTAIATAIAGLPLSQKIFLSCLLPTCLGFWRNEYGVSYAYGTATALTSYWIWNALIKTTATATTTWATWHAAALIFYGVRLCMFLAYRESCTQAMKDSVQRIEERARARGNRLQRTPFILACAGLYFGLCAPLLITSRAATVVTVTQQQQWMAVVCKTLVGMTWGGFLFAALGDFNKSLVKAIKGESHLVTGGIYQFCRHPNYTGEIIGWTSNGLLAIVAAAMMLTNKGSGATLIIPPLQLAGYLLASIVGALGLDFVLFQATGGLEKRQKKNHGDSKDYQKWIASSWAGFQLLSKVVDEASAVAPEIEVVDTEEKGGSGI